MDDPCNEMFITLVFLALSQQKFVLDGVLFGLLRLNVFLAFTDYFLRATACNAIARLCYDRGVLPSVCPSVHHTAVLCLNDATEDHEIFTV